MIGEKLQVERLAASEAARLMVRDRSTYAKLLVGLYAAPLMRGVSFDDARLARASYFYARYIDDALDGENSRYPGQAATPDQLPVRVSELNNSPHKIATLGRYAISGLIARQRNGDDPIADMQRLVDSMVFDYQRTRDGLLFHDESQLEDYYSDAMRGTNLMLIGFHSELREDTDIPSYSHGLARVYTARDLAEDWGRGTINVPSDKLKGEFGVVDNANQAPSLLDLLGSDTFIEWQTTQLDGAARELNNTIELVSEINPEDIGSRVVTLLANQALGYIPRINEQLGA